MRHDVFIVGAGPAGAQLALRLSSMGWDVGLLDRSTFPRPKPCGEFMSPECVKLLGEIDLRESVLAEGAKLIRGLRMQGYGHVAKGEYRPIGKQSVLFDHGYGIRREILDDLTFRRAASQPNVTTYAGWGVIRLLRAPDGSVLGAEVRDPAGSTEFISAAFTVGADGRHSTVARELGVRRFVPWLSRFAIVTRFAHVPQLDYSEVHIFEGGYFTATPVDHSFFTLNLVVDKSAIPHGRGQLEGFLEECLRKAPPLHERLTGHSPVARISVVGPLAITTTEQIFDGAVLVGDACGFVDPLTGEGLYFAMKGAELLAEPLDVALSERRIDRDSLRNYALARRREFGPRYAFSRLLQRGLASPFVTRSALSLLEHRPNLADLVVGMTGDYAQIGQMARAGVWLHALRRRSPALADST